MVYNGPFLIEYSRFLYEHREIEFLPQVMELLEKNNK